MNSLNACFLQIAESSLRISLMILPLLVLRPWLRRWIGSQGLCLIWLLILVRLLVPQSVESSWGLTPQWFRQNAPASVNTPNGNAHPAISSGQTVEPRPPQTVTVSTRTAVSLIDLAGVAWVSGVALNLLWLALRQLRNRKLAVQASLVSDPRLREVFESIPAPLRDSVKLLENSAIDTPTLTGIIRPRIWFPTGWSTRLTLDDIRQILLHELGHIRRHDLAVQWLFALAQSIHWFNPFVWMLTCCSRSDREMACDTWVLSREQDSDPVQYGATLLKTVSLLANPRKTLPGELAMASSKRDLKTRIAGIGAFCQRPVWRTVAGMAFVFAGLILVTPRSDASGKKTSSSTVASKPTENGAAPGNPQKAEFVAIVARFVEFTYPAFDAVTAPGGVMEKLGPSKSSATAVHVLAPEEQEAILRVIHPMKGVDILTTPSVTSKSGQRSEIEIAREIKYPTEWVLDKKLQRHTPTAFEVKKAGIMLETEATVKPDGKGIDLHTVPQIVEFLGFQSTGSEKPGKALTEKPTPDHPYTPVFRTRKVTNKAELISGQTLLIWLRNRFSEKDSNPPGPWAAAVLVTPRILSSAEAIDMTRKSAEADKEKAH